MAAPPSLAERAAAVTFWRGCSVASERHGLSHERPWKHTRKAVPVPAAHSGLRPPAAAAPGGGDERVVADQGHGGGERAVEHTWKRRWQTGSGRSRTKAVELQRQRRTRSNLSLPTFLQLDSSRSAAPTPPPVGRSTGTRAVDTRSGGPRTRAVAGQIQGSGRSRTWAVAGQGHGSGRSGTLAVERPGTTAVAGPKTTAACLTQHRVRDATSPRAA